MPAICAAVGCSQLNTAENPLSFHAFPPNKKETMSMRKEWITKVNRVDRVTKKPWEPKTWDRLCSKHFTDDCFNRVKQSVGNDNDLQFRVMLDRTVAIPTIFPHKANERKAAIAKQREDTLSKRTQRKTVNHLLKKSKEGNDAESEVHENTDILEGAASSVEPVESPRTKDVNLQIKPDMSSVKLQTDGVKMVIKAVQAGLNREQQTRTTQTAAAAQLHSSSSQTFVEHSEESDEDEKLKEEPDPAETRGDDEWGNVHPKPARHILTDDLDTMNPFQERKYIVFESQLEELLKVCRKCCKTVQPEQVGVSGTSVEYRSECECGYKFNWRSQPYSNQMPIGNLVLAAAAFFAACSPTRLITTFKEANIAVFSYTTYNKIQSSYLLHAVRNVWKAAQDVLFAARNDKAVKVAGDGRCDSPGHTAKYGSYTLMDAETSEILHCELVQSNQVKNSHAMELDGLKKCLHSLRWKVNLSHLITDRHASVKKYMRENHSSAHHDQEIVHRFDVWHMAKGVAKKIETASRPKRNVNLSLWTRSITNHMYWSSSSTPEGPDRGQIVTDKWVSISNHVANIHDGHGDSYPCCTHGELEPRAWIEKGSLPHKALDKIIRSPFLLRDIGMLSPDVQTASLESYHAVVCHFAPKLTHFTYPVMQAKLLLAALHFNANAGRKQAVTEEGELKWAIVRKRAKKNEPVAVPVKVSRNRNYITELNQEVLRLRKQHGSYKKALNAQTDYKHTVPETLTNTAGEVDKAAVVNKHRSRIGAWRQNRLN